eukprot:165918_1
MNIVYDNIQYLPYELDITGIQRHILHKNRKVYPILKVFCQEYNRLIKSVDFLFKIKKQASQFVDNQPELSAMSLPNNVINKYYNPPISYGAPTTMFLGVSYPNMPTSTTNNNFIVNNIAPITNEHSDSTYNININDNN